MGNYFSNRWQGYTRKQTVTEIPQLTIKELQKRFDVGMFTRRTAPSSTTFFWYRQGRIYKRANVVFMNPDTDTPQLRVLCIAGGKELKQRVDFTSTPVHFGGVRWWFVCPLCNRRCGSLHIAAPRNVFACRKCHDLSYTSAQTAHEHDRGRFAKLGRLILLERRYEKIYSRMSKHARWTKAYKRGMAQLEKIEKELDTLAGINMFTGDGL